MKKRRLSVTRRMCRYAIHAAVIVSLVTVSLLSFLPATTVFAANKFFTCTPVDVAALPKRIHVKCSPGDGPILWFALGVTDDGDANRMLSIISTAFVTKKKLSILYDPDDLDGAKIGCETNSCRLIRGAIMF